MIPSTLGAAWYSLGYPEPWNYSHSATNSLSRVSQEGYPRERESDKRSKVVSDGRHSEKRHTHGSIKVLSPFNQRASTCATASGEYANAHGEQEIARIATRTNDPEQRYSRSGAGVPGDLVSVGLGGYPPISVFM